LAESFKAKLWN